jgi:hypothetical protein
MNIAARCYGCCSIHNNGGNHHHEGERMNMIPHTWKPLGDDRYETEIAGCEVHFHKIDEKHWAWKVYGIDEEEKGVESSCMQAILAATNAAERFLGEVHILKIEGDVSAAFGGGTP